MKFVVNIWLGLIFGKNGQKKTANLAVSSINNITYLILANLTVTFVCDLLKIIGIPEVFVSY